MSWDWCFHFTDIGPFWDLVSKKIHNHSVIIHFWRLWRCIIAEISKIHWKSKIEKHQYYFANISATKARIFMKFYVVVNYYLVGLYFKFHKDSCINARARVVNTRAHVLSRLRAFTTLDTNDQKIVIDHHIRFHEDLSFRCGDIFKTILVFFNHWYSMYFWYFCNYAPPKPSSLGLLEEHP